MSRKKQEKVCEARRYGMTAWLLTLLVFVVTGVRAASIDKEMAEMFANNWLMAAGNALNTQVGAAEVGKVEELKDGNTLIGYVVSLKPEGYLVLSADDRINPLVVVSRNGAYDYDKKNPMQAFVEVDMKARLAYVEKNASEKNTRGGDSDEGVKKNIAAWDKYLKPATRAEGTAVVSEVWVDSFVKSRWSQSGGIYNYYTPTIYDKDYKFEEGNPNNAPCGCVATGTAQILRYFQWPQKPVGIKTGSCTITTVNGTEISLSNLNLRGGDGNGGAYNWDIMTLVPTGAEKIDTFKQIGALCYDAGLTVGMGYSKDASGSNFSARGFTNNFQYMNAANVGNADRARANLDARRPVAVSIASIIPQKLGGEGHAIVCDGYGRLDGRWYYHMNMGWAGSGDAWYNCEEVFSANWTPSFSFDVGNIYRQKLQANDVTNGQIISGRITDANGNPVAGVKVSIKKQGSEDIHQTMLVWNEPKDPIATPIYCDWDLIGNNNGVQEENEIPGADKFRNTTDENGIWAIDKVGAGKYEIVLEKDGLNFSGNKSITVNSYNIWANDFVASPLDNLVLNNWWKEGDKVYLQFNRAVGKVDVDLSKAKIGSTALTAGKVQVIASSDTIVIDGISASGNLMLNSGFLTVDVDGSYTTDQANMYNVKKVVVLEEVNGIAAGAAPAKAKVTSITCADGAVRTKNNLLKFKVAGNGLTDADINNFKIRNITTGTKGTQVPNVSINSWNPATGELIVRAFNGESMIGIDYVPETGRSYLSSELYTFDDCGPAIIKAELDQSNKFVTVTWNEKVTGWIGAVAATDLNVILHNNGGTITKAQIESVEKISDTVLKVNIKYTPSLEVVYNKAAATSPENLPYNVKGGEDNWLNDDATIAAYRVPAGVETIEIVPREGKVYDELKNASATSNTTDKLLLFDNKRPRLVSAIMSNDNYSVQLTFNKRIFGSFMGTSPILQIAALQKGAISIKDLVSSSNFKAEVVYQDKSAKKLTINNNGVYYTIGTNFIYIDFNYNSSAENRRLLDSAYNSSNLPEYLKLTISNIMDKDENPLVDNVITIPLWPKYTPGKTSLLPPMFTNAKHSYTHIQQPNGEVLVTKAAGTTPENYLYTPYGEGTCGVDPASEGLIYYGIYYRDLDGDGRIDAVDLNYHNPDYNNGSSPATLYAGASAAANFRVYVQNNDPNDIDDSDKQFYPADSEGVNWSNFPTNAPLGNNGDGTIYNFQNNALATNFGRNWVRLTPTSCEVIAQNQLKGNGNSNNERYSTLRLYIDQTKVRPRTYGTRFVMVSYTSPRNVTTYSGNGSVNYTYNKWALFGAKAPTNDTYGANYVRYNDSDETAGVYWRRAYTGTRSDAIRTSGCMDNVHIADGFGPVVAWDGAGAVPITATAWRATPYPKSGESNMDGYEYLDVTFSEPIAYADDHAMSGCGYTKDESPTPNGYLHGCWGAEVISANTVRFKVNGVHTSKSFTFSGALFEMSPGFLESYANGGTRNRTSMSFSVNAVGVKPVDSRYKVVSQDSAVDMFIIDASGSNITSNGSTGSTTFTQSVNTVELKGLEQGGDWRSQTANWLCNSSSIGAVGTTVSHNAGNTTSNLTYSIRSNNLSTTTPPGSSVYGIISSIIVRNNNIAGFIQGGNAGIYCAEGNNKAYAPDPIGRNMAFVGSETPVGSVMSGPVYNMVKVAAINQASGTSRIQAGITVSVLGIDIAGSAAHKLTAIKVRAVDTSMGQFDPSIDFEPLADGASSGVILYNLDNNSVVKVSNNGDEWSEWKTNEAGQPYKEVTLRPLTPVSLATAGGNANSFNFEIRVKTSSSFNLGDSFVIEIPDDGIEFGSYKTVDNRPATWGTPNGARGFAFTDFRYRDNNNDNRWAEGDSITSAEDPTALIPLYDGGKPYFTNATKALLAENGVNVKNLYYAKKNWATNPESNPFYGIGNVTNSDKDKLSSILGNINFIGSTTDLNYNVSYTPGDDIWYDIGGEPGVYDEGIDIPLFGNANLFPLSWQVAECGAKSAQYRAAATAKAGTASTGFISAPSNGPVATVGLDMRDAGRGFGPRFILNDSILIESISKNIAGGEYSVVLKNNQIIWNNGKAYDIPENNARKILDDGMGTFIVIRTLDKSLLPATDTTVNFTVSKDSELDIQQPSKITGVRVTALGSGNVANTKATLKRNGTKLSWDGGIEVDVADGGYFFLNGGDENYLVVQVSQVGGATAEELCVYAADGRSITPFLNISGLEIMTVSDMVPQGYYTFSYDGAGTLSWGNGSPAKVNVGEGEFVLVEGNGTNLDYAQNFVVVRRTAGPLPSQAVTDTLFINQSQLLRVAVSVNGGNGFSITHLAELTNDENSGVSLWWDANADGTFNTGDKYVKLLETPVFTTSGTTYSTVLTPDPQFITAWLSCSQTISDISFNFFVCVNTTEDMSYGDSFSVSASFYEPTEPNYDNGGNCFASANSGNIVCTSITNTVFKKKTTKGQNIDANTAVTLASISHFVGTPISGKEVYMTAVEITIIAPEGSTFHPDTAFTDMKAATAGNRGILLKAANGNVIPCDIELITDNPEKGPWKYVLRPVSSAGDSLVPQADDEIEDHFIVVNLAKTLPYGVSFYARMETNAVTYNTGVGSAAAAMVTDVLGSTINSEYADLLDSSMVTPTAGLVINKIGTGVASAYHNIKLSYDVKTNTYYLEWNGDKVLIDPSKADTYILGSGNNSLTVTFDPASFFMEDTLVTSESGRPDEEIAIGDKLTNLANQGLKYYDANANGRYDLYEPIAFEGNVIYGDCDASLCVNEITAASGLSFWDEDEDGQYEEGDSIFWDSDNEYTLPWMSLLVDSDNYITAGQGGSASLVTTETKFINAATVSPGFSQKLDKGIYLYYIDSIADGRGYVYGEDIVIARTVTTDGQATTGALQKDETKKVYDKVVYDPKYGKEGYVEISEGTLNQFEEMDYFQFSKASASDESYKQGVASFLSVYDKYTAPDFTWTIRVDKDRRIRWFSETAPAPYNNALKSITAIAGLDIACSGITDVALTSLKVHFEKIRNFTMDDLRALTNDENSGVQLWRDLDGNGIFNPDIDKLVKLKTAPTLSSDGKDDIVQFSPIDDNQITNNDVDGIYDFFVVVQPSITANNKLKVDDGDQFRISIKNNDVILNKTLNKNASLTSGTITIDSRFPHLVSEPVITDADKDGYIDSITLVFDEKLRPGMLDDVSIWNLKDSETGYALTVKKATLSDDYKTVKLTLSDADIGTTTGKVSVIVIYDGSESVLMDWAGNAVDFRINVTRPEDAEDITNYMTTSDTAAPQIVNNLMKIADTQYDDFEIVVGEDNFFFHDRNNNDSWDEGEDIWYGDEQYNGDVTTRVWNGGDGSWTTDLGYMGKKLDIVCYCDTNDNYVWDGGEFIWIDKDDNLEFDENDIAIPLNRTEEIDVYDRDNNGLVDAMRVYFSENVIDSTMTGYNATQDSYKATKWTVTGNRTLTAWRLGLKNEDIIDSNLKNKSIKDVINNNVMYFTFDEGEKADTGAFDELKLTVAAGETLADINGNKLNGSSAFTLDTNDRAKPVLLSAKSDLRIDKDGTLGAADEEVKARLTLTFSEPMALYYEGEDIAEALADLRIKKNGAWVEFDELAESVEVSEENPCDVLITMKVTDKWSYKTVYVKVQENIDNTIDTVLGDVAGNNVAINTAMPECYVENIVYKEAPEIVAPVAYDDVKENILRADNLNVQVFFGSYGYFHKEKAFDNVYQVTEWTLTILHNGEYPTTEENCKRVFTTETQIAGLANGMEVFSNREWLYEGGLKVEDYVLKLEMTAVDADSGKAETISCQVAFKAQAKIGNNETDIVDYEQMNPVPGFSIKNIGTNIGTGYIDFQIAKNEDGDVVLTYKDNSVVIDMEKAADYKLGTGDGAIQIHIDPNKLSGEDITCTVRVDRERRIKGYTDNAPAPFNAKANYYLEPIAGLDINYNQKIEGNIKSLTFKLMKVEGYDFDLMNDFRALTADSKSGIQLWMDAANVESKSGEMVGDGIFNADNDTMVTLDGAPVATEITEDGEVIGWSVKMNLKSQAMPVFSEDSCYDLYVAVQALAGVDDHRFKVVLDSNALELEKAKNITAIESEPVRIDGIQPVFTMASEDSDRDGYLEKLVMTSNEMLRPGMLNDLGIWALTDAQTGKPVTVKAVELAKEGYILTFTLGGADEGTTTGPVTLKVNYKADSALMDWAGNIVDLRGMITTDNVPPVLLNSSIDVPETESKRSEAIIVEDTDYNGKVDTMTVRFSEKVDITTMAGYTEGEFTSAAWKYAGRDMVVASFGGDSITFKFAEGDSYDTGDIKELAITGETLADFSGNILVTNGTTVNDMARPILVGAVAEGGKITADGIMPENVKVILTFTENIQSKLGGEESIANILKDFQIRKNGAWTAINESIVSNVAINGNQLVLDMTAGSNGWGYRSIDIKVVDKTSVFSDEAGNGLAASSVAIYPYDEANVVFIRNLIEFHASEVLDPNETDNYLREDNLAVKLALASACSNNAFKIDTWKFAVYSNGEQIGEVKEVAVNAANEKALANGSLKVFTNAEWLVDGGKAVNSYTVKVFFTYTDPDNSDESTNKKDFEASSIEFKALANKGLDESMIVRDGMNYGEDISEIQVQSSNVWSNWVWGDINITNNNLLIKSYKTYAVDGEGNKVSAEVTVSDAGDSNYVAKILLNGSLVVDNTYYTVVEAYDKDGDMIAKGASNGFTVKKAFDDYENMVFTDGTDLKVDNTNSKWSVITRTNSRDTLYAKWTAVSDALTSKAFMRYKYRVVSQFGSAEWSTDSNEMSAPRQDFASVVLNDKIYVIGGFQDEVLESVEEYDVATRAWSKSASLNEARKSFACVKLDDSRVIVAGGIGKGDEALASIELFDGSSWQLLSQKLPLDANGKAYDSVKAVKVDETHIVFVGTRSSYVRGFSYKTEVRWFDMSTMSFDEQAIESPEVSARHGELQIALQQRAEGGNNLVIAGGYDVDGNSVKTVDIVNLETRKVSFAELTDARANFAMIAVPDSKKAGNDNVWFIGGMNDSYKYLNTVDSLDAAGKIATMKGKLNVGRIGASALWNADLGNVIVAGGFTSDRAWQNVPEIAYNNGNEWVQCPATELPEARMGQHLEAVGTGLNEKRLVLFGGYNQKSMYIAETESCVWIGKTQETESEGWTLTDKNVLKVKVGGLSLKEGASYIFEVKAVDEQGYESVVSRSAGVFVSSGVIGIQLEPSITENAADGKAYTLSAVVPEGTAKPKYYHYEIIKNGEVIAASEDSIDIDAKVELPALKCEGNETTAAFEINIWSALDPQINDSIKVTVAKATFAESFVEPLDVDWKELTVKLNGLESFKYQLDDGAVVSVADGDKIMVKNLSVGAHTVSLWGIDSEGAAQAEATVLELFRKDPGIIGDPLIGTITGNVLSEKCDALTYTLKMSEAIVNAPVKGNFDVKNGSILSIEEAEGGDKTEYIIKVKPAGTGFVSMTLKPNTLFSATLGVPNSASEAFKTLYYEEYLASFTPETAADAYKVGETFTVDIKVKANYVFLGGDVGIMFDTEVFKLVDVDGKGNPDGTKMIAANYQNDGFVSEWIKDEDGSKIGIRLGGADGKATEKEALFATLTFQVLKEETAGSDITLIPLDNTDKYAGLALLELGGHVQGELLKAVEYNGITVKTELDRPLVTVTTASDTVNEGKYTMTISLAYALKKSVSVELLEDGVSIATKIITAGKTSTTLTVNKEDNLLTGDRIFAYNVVCNDDAVLVDENPFYVTVKDNDTAITMKAEQAGIEEGEEMVVTFTLAKGITAAADVTFNSPLKPETDSEDFEAGVDFRMDAEPVIPAGANSGSITIKTFMDNEIKGDYNIIVKLDEMFVGDNGCACFAGVETAFAVYDIDAVNGDFSGDGVVDEDDIVILQSHFTGPYDPKYDLNGDGVIDFRDVIILLSYMTRGAATRAVFEKVDFQVWLEADKTTVKSGDVITVTLKTRSATPNYPIMSSYCNVNFNEADLAYYGEYDAEEVVNDKFNSKLGGLAANGVSQAGGFYMSKSADDLSDIGLDGSAVDVAVMTFKVQETASDFINIDLSEFVCATYGANSLEKTLNVIASPLTLKFEDAKVAVPEFDVAFAAFNGANLIDNAALVIGLKKGTTFENDGETIGDLAAGTITLSSDYDVRVIDNRRGDDLKWDIRGLANRTVWNVQAYVKDARNFTLAWDDAVLPEYYNFTIVKGKETIDMRAAAEKAISLKAGTTEFQVVVEKAESAVKVEYTYELNAGWNLIGIPFIMDSESKSKFDATLAIYELTDADEYIVKSAEELKAGHGYWVYAEQDMEITIKADALMAAKEVSVKAGWQWVTPLMESQLKKPGAPVKVMWYYGVDGYQQVDSDSDIVLGRCYWIYSDANTAILQVK